MSTGARRILANTAYRLSAEVVSKLASIAFYVVMARELGPGSFGVFTFGFALVILATTLGNFGQDSVLTREVARDHSQLDRFFFNTMALKAVLSIASLAVTFAVAAAVSISSDTRDVLLLLGSAVVLEILTKTCFATFQAYERLEYVPVALITQRTVTALAGIAALLAGAGVVAVSAIYLAGAALGFVIALRLLRRVARPAPTVEPRQWWALTKEAAPIGTAIVFTVVLFRADMTMLAAFEPADVVGHYGAAYRLFEATLFVSWSVGTAVYPVFSRLSPTTEPAVGFVFERSLKLVIALTLPLAAGALVLAGPLVDILYGQEYADAAGALQLLAPAMALYPLSYVASSLLVSQHRQRAMMVVYGVVALENVLANLVLIPWLSLYGAALGTSISQLIVTVALLYYSREAAGALQWGRVVAGPLLATLAATVGMILLRDTFAAALAGGALLYLVVLLAFERLRFPDDARAVRDLLPRRT